MDVAVPIDADPAGKAVEKGDGGDDSANTKQTRKRTKTGCLTCRKRRIKCGEEKPTCANCRKSKRNCEGYNQRVVFKEPVNSLRPPVPISRNKPAAPRDIAPKPPRQPQPLTRADYSYTRSQTGLFPASNTSQASSSAVPSHKPQRNPFVSGFSSTAPPFPSATLEQSYHHDAAGFASENPPRNTGARRSSELQPQPVSSSAMQADSTDANAPNILATNLESSHENLQAGKSIEIKALSNVEMVDFDHDSDSDLSLDDETVSDTEMLVGARRNTEVLETREQDLAKKYLGIVTSQQVPHNGVPRSFTSSLGSTNILAEYRASPRASPLTDPRTAQVFYHFISVTAPCMNQFERNPFNMSWLLQGQPIPALQQHIWAYKMSALALGNPALLHAMLALGSLHIAKLQNAPIPESLRHYHIALRRVARLVGLPARRGQPETLAACMLLGYYEVWSADHQKWSNHLSGAQQLIEEIDFPSVTRYVKTMLVQGLNPYTQSDASLDPEYAMATSLANIDEELLGNIMGRRVKFADENVEMSGAHSKTYSRRDLETYESQRDLFWWYLKQDTYQSMLGGGKLFLDYKHWSRCPPRAPVGRLDATAVFLAKQSTQNSPGAAGPGPHPPGPSRSDQEAGQGIPPMTPSSEAGGPPLASGLIPNLDGNPTLPRGFTPRRGDSPSSSEDENAETEVAALEAEKEWTAILGAFDILRESFGPDLQPLGEEYAIPMDTPFGPALSYRSFPIACIWLNFYMGLIVLHRVHPSMPPFAMPASQIAAPRTAQFAQQIGRITGAIAPGISEMTGVSPMIGAALIESAFCLFFSGIQYQDYDQRVWTLEHLRGIARLVGWESADAIAFGLEKTWARVGATGRGPPWTVTSGQRRAPRQDEIIVPGRRRVDKVLSDNPERRLVVARTDRAHYALGILGVQEDLEKFDFGND